MQWTSGIAPGATIRVYAAGSLFYPDLDRALDMILADAQKPGGPHHLSISLGSREDLVSPDELKIQATMFLKLAALGVNTFVSSGDAGSNPIRPGRAAVLKAAGILCVRSVGHRGGRDDSSF